MKPLESFLLTEILRPLTRRMGTAFGAYLLSVGVTGETKTTIVAGMVAIMGVLVDLILSSNNRKKR